jgi:hypothetical protein
MILTKRILIHDPTREDVTETELAAELVALVDIMPSDVVIPLGAVQYSRSADHRRTPPVANSRAAVTLPKNMIAILHPSRRTQRKTFRRPTLLDLVRARTGMGKQRQQKMWFGLVLQAKRMIRPFIHRWPGKQADAGRTQQTGDEKSLAIHASGRNGETPVINLSKL